MGQGDSKEEDLMQQKRQKSFVVSFCSASGFCKCLNFSGGQKIAAGISVFEGGEEYGLSCSAEKV